MASIRRPGYGQPPAPPSQRPRPLAIAVWLMYAAAAIEIVYAVAEGQWLASYLSSLLAALEAADASGSGTQLQAGEIKNVILGAMIVVGVIAALIWLWIAWKNQAGRNWARIVATVLFALSCLGLPELLTGGRLSTMPSTLTAADGATIAVPPLDTPAWLIAAGAVNWLLGLAIIILLWRPAASRYYEAVSLSRRRPVPPVRRTGIRGARVRPTRVRPAGDCRGGSPAASRPQIRRTRRTRRTRNARPGPDGRDFFFFFFFCHAERVMQPGTDSSLPGRPSTRHAQGFHLRGSCWVWFLQ